jgi:hypothetical protein
MMCSHPPFSVEFVDEDKLPRHRRIPTKEQMFVDALSASLAPSLPRSLHFLLPILLLLLVLLPLDRLQRVCCVHV